VASVWRKQSFVFLRRQRGSVFINVRAREVDGGVGGG